MALELTRTDGTVPVAQTLAEDTLGALGIDPRWFGLDGGITIDGDTAQSTIVAFDDEGRPAERFRVTLTVDSL